MPIAVDLSSATTTGRALTRAIANAVNDLAARAHRLPWQPRDHYVIIATLPTWGLVYNTEEFGGPRPVRGPIPFHDRLMGMDAKVDPAMQPNKILVLDPISGLSETIEVR